MRSTKRPRKPFPFGFNPKVEHRNSRLRTMMRAGKLKPLTKAKARELIKQLT